MDVVEAMCLMLLAAALLMLIGHSFIDAFFVKKEELLTKMYQTEEGEV